MSEEIVGQSGYSGEALYNILPSTLSKRVAARRNATDDSERKHYPELDDQPDHESNGDQQERRRTTDAPTHIEPIGPRLSVRFCRSLTKQDGISRVVPKPYGKEIANNRNSSNRAIDEQIQTHSRQHDTRQL